MPELFAASLSELFPKSKWYAARRVLGADLIRFFDGKENVLAELHIKNDAPAELHPGPKCDRKAYESAVAAIEEQVFKSTKAVGRSIIFSDVPILGYFRYGDEFQMLPPPSDAPKYIGLPGGPYPLLLEFAFDRSSNEVINNFRIMKRAFELSSLLNLFLNRPVWARDFTLRRGWVKCDDTGETKIGTLIYGYNIPKSKKYSNFTDTDCYSSIRAINHSDYFLPQNSRYIVIGGGLDVPSNLNDLFGKAFSNKSIYEKLLDVAKRFSLATKLWDVSETAAYLAAVNAIESLLKPSRKETCEKCKKPLEGPTKAFKNFMDKYISNSHEESVKKVKKKIYDMRSDITHGGFLLGRDQHPYWSYFIEEMRDAEEGHILRSLVREAIIKWFVEHC